MMSGIEEIRKQNQRTLIILVLAFILPVAAAWLVYINMDSAGKTRNNGELITPPRPLEAFNVQTVDGKAFGFEQLKGNWHLVYIGSGACEQQCRDSLSKMHQTRLAQGKAMSRVRLLYLALDKKSLTNANELKNKYARLTVVSGERADVDVTAKLFQTDNKFNIREGRLIYMIDPLGNLMMRYKTETRLIGIIKDLEHLLKISQIG